VNRRDTSALEARLREALAGWPDTVREGVDMSARAIEQRVRDACEMSTLALALVAAGAQRPVK
jgi:hypothetical protein